MYESFEPSYFSEDAVAVSVAELSAADIQPLADKTEESTPIHVEFSEKNLREHTGRPLSPVCIEEVLVEKKGDSKSVQAFKAVFNEMLSLQANSKVRSVIFGKEPGARNRPTCKPTPTDFFSDVLLAAKRVLSIANYHLLCEHADEGFVLWHMVPDRVRKHVEEHVGRSLIARKIISNGNTNKYWSDDFMKRARNRRAA